MVRYQPLGFCQSAPTDGRDPFGSAGGFYTSKQNSDANGILYQWGRKDPFTFSTNSNSGGKYPIKIYTIDGVLIYQENNGGNSKGKQPVGGIINSLTSATSMMEAIKNPITFYVGSPYTIISQVGHTRSLWDYYWTSYSRGTDGYEKKPNWHTSYLDGYASQRLKSIYDPCPYGFKVSTNGTYNYSLKTSPNWIEWSYSIGTTLNVGGKSWFQGLGRREFRSGSLVECGYAGYYHSGSRCTETIAYYSIIYYTIIIPRNITYNTSSGYSVRCIEEILPRPTARIHLPVEVSIPVSKTVMLWV